MGKGLLHGHEELSLNRQNPCEKLGVAASAYDQCRRPPQRRSRASGILWPACPPHTCTYIGITNFEAELLKVKGFTPGSLGGGTCLHPPHTHTTAQALSELHRKLVPLQVVGELSALPRELPGSAGHWVRSAVGQSCSPEPGASH